MKWKVLKCQMDIEEFKEQYPSLDSYWRSIILFGRNVASYKFALAKSLLEIAPTGKTHITLEELSIPFSKHLCEHIAKAPRQATSQSSQFLEACKDFNAGKISKTQLINITTAKGFNNVIDAFHVVNRSSIPVEFYKKDYSNGKNKLFLRMRFLNCRKCHLLRIFQLRQRHVGIW